MGRAEGPLNLANQISWNTTRQYPLEMYGRGFRIFVTCLLRVAFLNYYPARWLLGKVTPGDPDYFLSFLSPVVALVLLLVAGWVWKMGLRRYSSAGN